MFSQSRTNRRSIAMQGLTIADAQYTCPFIILRLAFTIGSHMIVKQVTLNNPGCKMVVSWNRGTPKSSILMGFSLINHPFWGTPIYGNPHIYTYTHINLYIYIYTHTHTHIYIYYKWKIKKKYIYLNKCIYIYIHTYIVNLHNSRK